MGNRLLPPQGDITTTERIWLNPLDEGLDNEGIDADRDVVQAAFEQNVLAAYAASLGDVGVDVSALTSEQRELVHQLVITRETESAKEKLKRLKVAPIERPPMQIYYEGDTGYELDAPIAVCKSLVATRGTSITPREYLRAGAKPVEFLIRRLTARERPKVYASFRRDEPDAYINVVMYGCTDIRNGEAFGWEWKIGKNGGLADSVMDKLDERYPQLLTLLGGAILRLTQLTHAEGLR